MDNIIYKAEKTMKEHGMLPCRAVLVGLSGGADSAALLHILCDLSERHGFKVYAAHVNHGLRGAAADNDEAFSRSLAQGLGVEFFSLRADVKGEAKRRGISEELAGREIRYEFFWRIAEEHGIEYIATAHHKNDNAETILMNFMRGSGIKGLCGIPYRRGNIIRPLLDVSRVEIERYCRENGILYVTDQTNLQTVYTRSRARNILIPIIEKEFNPSFADTITGNSRLIADEEAYISSEADKAYGELVTGVGADAAALLGLHRAIALRVIKRMITEVCGSEDVPLAAVMSVFKLAKTNRTGSKADIVRGAYAVMEYGRLIIKPKKNEVSAFEYEIKLGEKTYISELGCYLLAEECSEYKRDGAEYFGVSPKSVIAVRNRREGDRFHPWGMGGTKKLKSFMIDEKIPSDFRDSVGILTFDGEIAWVIGYRRDERFKFEKKGIKISIIY